MIRLACLLQLLGITAVVALVARTNALTATVLMFAGGPSMVLGLLLYGITLRRQRGRSGPLSNH